MAKAYLLGVPSGAILVCHLVVRERELVERKLGGACAVGQDSIARAGSRQGNLRLERVHLARACVEDGLRLEPLQELHKYGVGATVAMATTVDHAKLIWRAYGSQIIDAQGLRLC